MSDSKILLAIDTCGPTGTVALGRLNGLSVEILSQIELEGRSYSSTLVAAVGDLLVQCNVTLSGVSAIVAVSGPGSFTGVRVGLAAIKGLAEPSHIPVVAVSRLEVLAAKSGVPSAALDAHRHEVFLRVGQPGDDLEYDLLELVAEQRIPAAHGGYSFKKTFCGIRPFHPLQHRSITALQRYVQMVADFGIADDLIKQLSGNFTEFD